jgi:hypothetical protein
MTWDRVVRKAAWVCFGLMWIAIAVFIFHHPADARAEEIMMPVFAFLALLFTFMVLMLVSSIGPLVISWHERRVVRKQGMIVPAVIRDIADTGIRLNNQQVFEITVTVRPPHEPEFDATIRDVIPYSSIPQVQPGQSLQVYYIPGTTRIARPE